MPPTAPPHCSFFWPNIPNVRVWKALELLLTASEAALCANRNIWDFAVEAQELRSAGLTNTDLRWLVSMGYSQHAQEQMSLGSCRRSFKPILNLTFPANTCFVATDSGKRLAVRGMDRVVRSDPGAAKCCKDALPLKPSLPRWDGVLRQLCWRGLVVKEFHSPARNQETILAALEEEGWPQHIDDPLSPVKGLDAKTRLHDAIKNLNRNQVNRLLCFRGNGNGKGVVWCPSIQPGPSLGLL